MKSHLDTLLDLKATGKFAEIRDTWAALGSLSVTPKTKLYVKDTLFKVVLPPYSDPAITPSDLYGALVYCAVDYKVDNDSFPAIDWENVSITDVDGTCSISDGVTSPHFKVILKYSDVSPIVAPVNEDYIPYPAAATIDSEISISDSELEIILGETGVPFLRPSELEYTREAILNTCLKPALQEYYKFFPIIQHVELGMVGCNVRYEYELPPYCYAAVRVWVSQTSGATGGEIGKGVYNFLMQTTGGGAAGSGFGRGINYRGKLVPGYTGGMDANSAYLMQRAANQSMMNYAKREKFAYEIHDKKRYLTGFSSVGGMVCAKLALWNPDWDYVQFDRLNEVRQLCTSYILQNLGMLRALVKTDVPGSIDYTLYTNRATTLYDRITKFWATLPTGIAVVQRG